MSYNTQETSEIRVSSKIYRTALTETLYYVSKRLIGSDEEFLVNPSIDESYSVLDQLLQYQEYQC